MTATTTTITTHKRLLQTLREHRIPIMGTAGFNGAFAYSIELPRLYGGPTTVSARAVERLWDLGVLAELRVRTHTALDPIVLGIRGVTCDKESHEHMNTPWCFHDDDGTFTEHRAGEGT